MTNWRQDLKNGMQTGNENDVNNIFVSLQNGFIFHKAALLSNDTNNDTENIDTLILMTIYVPKEQRNQGIFKDILDFVEERASKNGLHLFVGPLMSDDSQWIEKVCKHRGYQGTMPFGYLKK